MKKYSFALLALTVGLFSAAQAKASTIDTFDLTGDGNTFTFSLTSPSTPSTGHSCVDYGDFCYLGVTVDDNGHNQTDTIEFTNNDSLEIFNSHDQSVVDLSLNNHQSDYFSDNHGTFTFITGTYQLGGGDNGYGNDNYNYYYNCNNNSDYTLAIDPPAAVPEPSSLALMSSGLLAAAGAVRRRLKK